MNDPEVDPQRLAALLDGRLDEAERQATLEQLLQSDDSLALYADAAAVLRELDDAAPVGVAEMQLAERPTPSNAVGGPSTPPEGAGTRALPIGVRTAARNPRRARWLAIAASVAVLTLVPAVWLRTRAADSAPPTYVALLAVRDAGLPAGWDGTPWPTTRAAGDPLTGDARAVRVGARLADLELLADAPDPRAGRVAAELAALLDEVPGAGAAVAAATAVRTRVEAGEPAAPELVAAARRSATAAAGDEPVALGMWLEAARVAAARRDGAFFRSRESRAALDRAAAPALRALAPDEAATIRRLGPASTPSEWDAAARALTQALRARGA